jgi:RluA family pseudouridine synthase
MPKLSFQYVRQHEPETLIAFLGRRFRYHSPDEWEGLVRKGFVKVNGRKVSPAHVLETRHKIVYERPPFPEPEIDPTFSVLYEDDEVIAVCKSANMPTSPSGKYWDNCLVHVLQKALSLPWLHAVHRLDRETSGVNLLAKSKAAARTLGKDFQRGAVAKAYGAILKGHLPAREIYVSAPLRNAVQGEVRIKQAVHPEGREARTRFRLRALLESASLVEAVPVTGRTHQIRAHAALLGYPVVGDKLYGAPEADFLAWVQGAERSSGRRQLLHATRLSFQHPTSKQQITVHAPEGLLLDIFNERADASPDGQVADR